MYTKQEAAVLRQQFWTSFGKYMQPVPSADGLPVNWINYKTGIKDLHFKMETGNTGLFIAILLTHTDQGRQLFFFNRLLQLKKILEEFLKEEWTWELQVQDENNKTVSRIYTSLVGPTILNREDWPAIISFFKPRMMALDAFWSEIKYGFEK